MNYILAPSLLAADFQCLAEQMKQTEENGAKYLHFDVMDGMFVPSISFGVPVLKSIKGATNQVMDVHLMVQEPIRYVKDFAQAGADIITVHLEACSDVGNTLREIKACGKKTGLSICPQAEAEELLPYLDLTDMILVMSVQPGFGGQKFIVESLEKIRKVRGMIEKSGQAIDLEVDGGIYQENVEEVLKAGANVIVAGSAVFGGNPGENTRVMMERLKQYE